MLTKTWLGFVVYERPKYTEELLGEEGDYEVDGESGMDSDIEDRVMA